MTRPTLFLVLTGIVLAALPASAQAPAAPPLVISPEVHADRTVTFRLRAPNAQEVLFAREGTQRAAMQKNSEGVWTYTTDALEPDFYGYTFVVDGVSLMDPSNSMLKTKPAQPVEHVPCS
jgi:1,4-alpha-glucan branching enzyme